MIMKPLLFFSSYAPLFILFTIRFKDGRYQLVCLILAVLGVIGALYMIRMHSGENGKTHTIVTIREAGPEATTYLATYLLPFVTVGEPSNRDLVMYGVYFLILGVVHIRSSTIQVNPTLYLLNKKIVEITDENNNRYYVIAHKELERGERVKLTDLSNDVLLQKPDNPNPPISQSA